MSRISSNNSFSGQSCCTPHFLLAFTLTEQAELSRMRFPGPVQAHGCELLQERAWIECISRYDRRPFQSCLGLLFSMPAEIKPALLCSIHGCFSWNRTAISSLFLSTPARCEHEPYTMTSSSIRPTRVSRKQSAHGQTALWVVSTSSLGLRRSILCGRNLDVSFGMAITLLHPYSFDLRNSPTRRTLSKRVCVRRRIEIWV